MRNKPPKEPIIHYIPITEGLRWPTSITSCGQHVYENHSGEPNILFSNETGEVTCGSCRRAHAFRKKAYLVSNDIKTQPETVGIPTQPGEERPVSMGKVMQEAAQVFTPPPSNSFGADEPLIHAATGSLDHTPLCSGSPFTSMRGFSTMDGGAVNCRYCLNSEAFIKRNDMFTEMMSPSHEPDAVPPVAKYHDEDEDLGPGVPLYVHDCEACVFLGSTAHNRDMYWCGQGEGKRSTVILRYGNSGPDYSSGLANAANMPELAMAVVRAFKLGLLTDTDMSWL